VSRENVASRRYPLTRVVFAYIKVPPGDFPEPAVREFLRYVLSEDGQRDVARDEGFLPLPATVADQQRRLFGIKSVSAQVFL